jgi:hypothetical protein
MFGKDRLTNYKSGWFCSQCDEFDNLLPLQQAKRKGAAKYKCVSHHHYTVPQQKHKVYFLGTKKDAPDSSSASDSSVNQIESEPSAVDLPRTQKRDWPSVINLKSEVKHSILTIKDRDFELKELEEEAKRMKLKVVSEQKMTSKYRRWFLDSKKTCGSRHGNANTTSRPKPTSVQEQLKVSLMNGLRDKHNKLAPKTKAKVLVDMVFDTDFLDGAVHKLIIVEARQFFRENVYREETVLGHMDQKGRTRNYAGIEVLRQVENQCFMKYYQSTKKPFQSILPFKSALVVIAKVVEEWANEFIPIDKFSTEEGEGVLFRDIPAVMKMLVKAYGLEDAANIRSVEFATCVDAALVNKAAGALTFGAVIIDTGDIDPQTKIPLCLHQMQPITNLIYRSFSIRYLVQSPKYVYPLVLLVG